MNRRSTTNERAYFYQKKKVDKTLHHLFKIALSYFNKIKPNKPNIIAIILI